MDAELASKFPDLILEELTQGLDKLETLAVNHALGKTTDVVMGLLRLDWNCSEECGVAAYSYLDGGRRALEGDAFDNIRIEGTLKEL